MAPKAEDDGRKRISKACDLCYGRRHKCDGKLPCKRCQDAGVDCRYDRVAKKRGPSGPGKRKDVQIKQEDAISSPGSGVESPAPTQLASYSGAQSFSGLSVMSASSSLVSPLQLLRMPQNPANPRDFLPPPEILERLVQVFFENVHPFLPVIHRETFLANPGAQSPLVLLSICGATCGRGVAGMDAELQAHAERCLDTCSALLIPSMISPDQVSFDNVLASLHFDHAAGNRTHPHITDRWLGFSVSALLQRQLNVEGPADGQDWITREQRRRAWWRMFGYDRAAAMQNGRTCLISEEANLLRLPLPDALWTMPAAEASILQATIPPRYLPSGLEGIRVMLETQGLRDWPTNCLTLFLFTIYGHVNRVSIGLRALEIGAESGQEPLYKMLEQQRQSLAGILDLFWGALDIGMKRLDEEPLRLARSARKVNGDWVWSGIEEDPVALCMLLLYHTLRILVVSPGDLSRMLRSPSWLFSSDFISAVEHAGAISRLLDTIMATNPDLNFVHPALGFCVVTAASVHIALVRSLRNVPQQRGGALTNGEVDPVPEHTLALQQVHSQASRDVEVSIRAMEGLGKRWKLAQKTGRALRQALDVMDWSALDLNAAGHPNRAAPMVKGADGPEDDDERDHSSAVDSLGGGFALKVLADLADVQMRSRALEAAEDELERIQEQQQRQSHPALTQPTHQNADWPPLVSGPWQLDRRPQSRGRLTPGISAMSPSYANSPSFPNDAGTPTLPSASIFPPTMDPLNMDNWVGNGVQDELQMLMSGSLPNNSDYIFF